jgi:hypothetical protein
MDAVGECLLIKSIGKTPVIDLKRDANELPGEAVRPLRYPSADSRDRKEK